MSADKVVRTELITPEPAEALANLLGTDIPRPRRCERALAPRAGKR